MREREIFTEEEVEGVDGVVGEDEVERCLEKGVVFVWVTEFEVGEETKMRGCDEGVKDFGGETSFEEVVYVEVF